MWTRRDWQDFFQSARNHWQTRRPPRPVELSSHNRALPAVGYSLAELTEAGMSIEQAEIFGLPVDAGRIGALGLNVSALREFARVMRRRP